MEHVKLYVLQATKLKIRRNSTCWCSFIGSEWIESGTVDLLLIFTFTCVYGIHQFSASASTVTITYRFTWWNFIFKYLRNEAQVSVNSFSYSIFFVPPLSLTFFSHPIWCPSSDDHPLVPVWTTGQGTLTVITGQRHVPWPYTPFLQNCFYFRTFTLACQTMCPVSIQLCRQSQCIFRMPVQQWHKFFKCCEPVCWFWIINNSWRTWPFTNALQCSFKYMATCHPSMTSMAPMILSHKLQF